MHPMFSTCDLCDAHADALASGALRVLPPVFRSFGKLQRFRGRIATLRCRDDNLQLRALLETAGLARVLVVDGGGSLARALMGGRLGELAVRNGWAGALIHGAVRDTAELAATPIGVLALAPMPVPPRKDGGGEVGVELQIQGVTIRPDEWLYADEDGVLISATELDLGM